MNRRLIIRIYKIPFSFLNSVMHQFLTFAIDFSHPFALKLGNTLFKKKMSEVVNIFPILSQTWYIYLAYKLQELLA